MTWTECSAVEYSGMKLACEESENCCSSVLVSFCCEKLVAEAGGCSGTKSKGNIRR
jgi:hypothetical protein